MTLAEITPATKLLERWQPRGNGNTNDGHTVEVNQIFNTIITGENKYMLLAAGK